MNNKVIIIGGIALVGVVAYFYLKPKVGATTNLSEFKTTGTGTETGTVGSIMPPAGTVFTTPEEVEAITVKISTAKDLTDKICELKTKFKISEDEMNDFMNFTSIATMGINFTNPISSSTSSGLLYQSERRKAIPIVADSIKKLAQLGYKEVECKMVKIA